MSDTDDTDLLLLIPPDFFLVHSPDLCSSDSDCDFGYGHDELKDSIVSDLITQVNDLESRICMIENVDRSTTQCSACNEDSHINQSVNSLTESDILRAHICEKTELLTQQSVKNNLMLKTFEEDVQSSIDVQKNVLGLQGNSSDLTSGETIIGELIQQQAISRSSSGKHNNDTETQEVGKNCVEPENQMYKDNPTALLNEIDSFLKPKNKQKLGYNCHRDTFKDKKLDLASQLTTNSEHRVVLDNLFNTENSLDLGLGSKSQNFEPSLALPEVYQLLQEMEETQYEIEKKLKLRDSQRTSEDLSLSNRIIGNKAQGSQVLSVKDLYSRPGTNKQIESLFENYKTLQPNETQTLDFNMHANNINPPVSYLYSQTPSSINEDILPYRNDNKLKSVSPNRTSVSRNPIDIVKANLPSKHVNSPVTEFGDDKDSPRKGVRRHLNFARHNFPMRVSNSRPSLQIEHITHQIDREQKHANGRLNVDLKCNANADLNIERNTNLEQQFNSLVMQGETSEKVNQNAHFGLDQKSSSSQTLHQKLSANNLLSLSELWNKEPTFYSDDPNKLRQKLEEEKYRRQHCEQQIQVLQLRVLEEQEKLAVAIRVDQEKDKALLQITESWRKMNEHWSELEKQRHSLAQQLQDEKEAAKVRSEEQTKKIERWEKEVSQALDLAAGYKDKSETLQNKLETVKRDTEEKLKEATLQLDKLNEENEKTNYENKTVMNKIKLLQDKIEEEEELLTKLKNELEKSKKQVSEYEAEINILKEQKESITSKIRDEKNRSSILEQQKNSLQQAMIEATKREKAAQDELKVNTERMEVARTELRALYQGQLETVVKEKLQDFQSQLDAAEAALKAELVSKEKLWAEKSNEQCRILKEKHKIDLQRLEESRREDINKWKEMLMESERQRSIIESRLQEETNRRGEIAQRLHNVMETQWREALNIISNPMQNVYEVARDESKNRWLPNQPTSERLKGSGDLKASRSNSTSSLVQTEEAPFCKEGLVTYRTAHPQQDQQLKKYIQMLLERGPGNPIPQHDTSQDIQGQIFSLENSLLDNKWIQEDPKKSTGQIPYQSSKPPWK